MNNKKKVFLGINVSHGASAALMINGEIALAFQEERFNKIKNYGGYPKTSIDKCINFAIDKNLLIDEAAFTTVNNNIFNFLHADFFLLDNISFIHKVQLISLKI